MMGEDRFENVGQNGYRSLWEMFQLPVWDTVRPGALLTLRPLMAS